MTPRELQLHVDEYNERVKQEREAIIIQAYHTARFYRVKKMPSLNRVLASIREVNQPKREQSPLEMLTFAKRFMTNLERKE